MRVLRGASLSCDANRLRWPKKGGSAMSGLFHTPRSFMDFWQFTPQALLPLMAALAAAAAACDWTPVSAAMSLRNVHAGDVLVVPLGDTPRRDARTIARLEPLISGLKARGLCFATLREHPSYRSQFAW